VLTCYCGEAAANLLNLFDPVSRSFEAATATATPNKLAHRKTVDREMGNAYQKFPATLFLASKLIS
jgi:hypothetical protein